MRKRIDVSLGEKTISELRKMSKQQDISVSRILEDAFKKQRGEY
jgi:hypothetical protein